MRNRKSNQTHVRAKSMNIETKYSNMQEREREREREGGMFIIIYIRRLMERKEELKQERKKEERMKERKLINNTKRKKEISVYNYMRTDWDIFK